MGGCVSSPAGGDPIADQRNKEIEKLLREVSIITPVLDILQEGWLSAGGEEDATGGQTPPSRCWSLREIDGVEADAVDTW